MANSADSDSDKAGPAGDEGTTVARPSKMRRRWWALIGAWRYPFRHACLLPSPEVVRAPADVYQVDPGRLATVRWLGAILGLLVLFSLGPVFRQGHLALGGAPYWARVAVALAVLQAAYVVWMVNVPDWSSVWVVMLVFAVVAALYALATAVAWATPPERPLFLGMNDVRRSAGAWCGAVCLVMSLATYLCGRLATRWRKAFELTMVIKRRDRGR